MWSLRKIWNAEKHDVAPWWAENSKHAYESGLIALAAALSNYSSSKKGTRAGPKMGFPNFKKKRTARRSCRFSAGVSIVDERHVRFPRIGVVRSREKTTALSSLIDSGKARILNATLSEAAERWFVSFSCEVERNDAGAKLPDEVVGVDLGVHHLAALSSGELVENPKALSHYQRKMRRLHRELSRRTPGSNRRRRTKRQLAKLHHQVACSRSDAIHQLSSRLGSDYGTVVIEDLHVKGMTASARGRRRREKAGLNRSILDVAPGEFRRQLSYKLEWHGGTLVVADRWFASSKICSSCGVSKATLALSMRTFRCESCGVEIDRDLNAARNLRQVGMHVAEGSSETNNGRGGVEVQGGDTWCTPVKRLGGSGQPQKTTLVGR